MEWDAVRISKSGLQKVWEEYNTMSLLHSVDALDQIRYILADEEETLRPPEIRQQLMELHGFAHKLLNENYQLTNEEIEKMWALREDIENEVMTMQDHLDFIRKALNPLDELFADPDDDEDLYDWDKEG